MKYFLSKKDKNLNGTINLPSSKSISNRLLIIHSLSNSDKPIENISTSDDTIVMQKALHEKRNLINIGHAGTAMRFLTAYFSIIPGERIITGSERMKQRPIKILVDALRILGAEIEYEGNEGFPPLKIKGKNLKGGKTELNGNISSQYISALLLIAPILKGGLTLHLTGNIISRSYIEMTLKLMEQSGILWSWKGPDIHINEQSYNSERFFVESDWTAASYWYEMLSLSDSGSITLKNLHSESLQGDCILPSWFKGFNIKSKFKGDDVILEKTDSLVPKNLKLNFTENPDLAQTMVVLCVLKNIPFHFTGLKTLKIKETDRIFALKTELAKLGANITEPANGELSWDGSLSLKKDPIPCFSTYTDHRMALSLSPVAMCRDIIIDSPEVVTKSYPLFFKDLVQTGYIVRENKN